MRGNEEKEGEEREKSEGEGEEGEIGRGEGRRWKGKERSVEWKYVVLPQHLAWVTLFDNSGRHDILHGMAWECDTQAHIHIHMSTLIHSPTHHTQQVHSTS